MKEKHPIRIGLEVLAVVLLAGLLFRMYLSKSVEGDKGPLEDSPVVSKVIKERASEQASTERVFGQEPEGKTAVPSIEEQEASATLVLTVVNALTGEIVTQPMVLISEQCGWQLPFPNGEISAIVPAGRCDLRIESAAASPVVFLSDQIEVQFVSGQTVQRQLGVELPRSAAPAIAQGAVAFGWVRQSEWIEISEVLPGSSLAQVGLQSGDIILEVNGFAVNGLNDNEIAALLVGPLAEPVILTLAVAEGETWLEVPVTVSRESITY